ncbi:unnamed protein product [Ostreobium quekettii]|uniref:Uncharacterized protein n=1 Tax=Ostreobium quekettii TaxID=121088 RepID=A0A8S1IN13_9CHLO|nr:unnamed protein product [Ostreobium quekettii]
MGMDGGQPTLSIAVPGSVIDNTQSVEQATMVRKMKAEVAGQIARAAAVFNVNEVVVVDDSGSSQQGRVGYGAAFLARLLQYQETPQYLRKLLIPVHPDLKYAGLLHPLDIPSHMRATEWREYREGVVLDCLGGAGAKVEVGLSEVNVSCGEYTGCCCSLIKQSDGAEWGSFDAVLCSVDLYENCYSKEKLRNE